MAKTMHLFYEREHGVDWAWWKPLSISFSISLAYQINHIAPIDGAMRASCTVYSYSRRQYLRGEQIAMVLTESAGNAARKNEVLTRKEAVAGIPLKNGNNNIKRSMDHEEHRGGWTRNQFRGFWLCVDIIWIFFFSCCCRYCSLLLSIHTHSFISASPFADSSTNNFALFSFCSPFLRTLHLHSTDPWIQCGTKDYILRVFYSLFSSIFAAGYA